MLKNLKGMYSEDENPTNCIARRVSHTWVLLHLANFLGRQQPQQKSEEFGRVLGVPTTMKCCDWAPRSIWMPGIMKKMVSVHCCMLNKKLQTTHFTIQKGF